MKYLFYVAAMFAVVSVNAQINFGVKAGVTASALKMSDGTYDDLKMINGFTLGITTDLKLSEAFCIQSRLSLITKGCSNTGNAIVDREMVILSLTKETARPLFLQLPIHLAYKINIGQNSKIVFNTGPYFAYGMKGKVKTKRVVNSDVIYNNENYDFFENHNNCFRRFDYGLGFGAGMEFGKFGFNVEYDLGLANISRSGDWILMDSPAEYVSAKLNCLSFTVGYKF